MRLLCDGIDPRTDIASCTPRDGEPVGDDSSLRLLVQWPDLMGAPIPEP
ncbi:MAG: hypothetical protein OXF06_00145 [Bacteroidetes bacterium]|nr:hypothetical protein [Bacteroidota bacterium]